MKIFEYFRKYKPKKEPSLDFYMQYHNIITNYENQIVDLNKKRINSTNLPLKDQIYICEMLISIFDNFRNFCSADEYTFNYFNNVWMHCHNNKNHDFSFIDPTLERLDYLNNHPEEVELEISKLNKIASFEKNADEEILNVLAKHNGILQKDFYKFFDSDFKKTIQSKLYFWAKDNKIMRVKEGNTYKLFIND